MVQSFEHRPVMLDAVLNGLNLEPEGKYIDCTFGRGGHSKAILDRLGPKGALLVIDKDLQAFRVAEQFGTDSRVQIYRGSYADLGTVVSELGWEHRVDGILLDLGVSSPQLDDPERGFSFLRDGPLDMRMDTDSGISAAQWLAAAPEDEISKVLRDFGEERFARRIARTIVKARQQQPVNTTAQLVELIEASVPGRERNKHPATRSFQAIRIYINHELEELQAVLPQAVDAMAPHGRLVVISFHSLEDRIVKRFIRNEQRGEELPPDLPVIPETHKPRLKALCKPVRATEEEINSNPRARSAVLRIAERAA